MTRKILLAAISIAAFYFSSIINAQPAVVDVSAPLNTAGQAASDPQAQSGQNASELFYQLQLLQQEVMQLRGVVEEQSFQLKQLKQQSMDRYIELDRRLATGAAPSAAEGGSSDGADSSPVAATTKPSNDVAPMAGEKAAYDAAYRLVTSKQFIEAQEAFKQFLIDFPDGKYAPNSYYWLGELYQVIQPKDLEASRQAFTQLVNLYPDHPKTPDAMYKLGKVYFLKGNKQKSRQWLDKVIAQYGSGVSSAADKSRQFIQENF